MVFLVGKFDLRRGDITFKLLHGGYAGDRGHRRVADNPGQRDLRRSSGMRGRHLSENFDQIRRAIEVFRKEERVPGSHGVCGPVPAMVVA
jgi:hypothetical protein